jgi:hypothetical protein
VPLASPPELSHTEADIDSIRFAGIVARIAVGNRERVIEALSHPFVVGEGIATATAGYCLFVPVAGKANAVQVEYFAGLASGEGYCADAEKAWRQVVVGELSDGSHPAADEVAVSWS